jgi:hypothetical protein
MSKMIPLEFFVTLQTDGGSDVTADATELGMLVRAAPEGILLVKVLRVQVEMEQPAAATVEVVGSKEPAGVTLASAA